MFKKLVIFLFPFFLFATDYFTISDMNERCDGGNGYFVYERTASSNVYTTDILQDHYYELSNNFAAGSYDISVREYVPIGPKYDDQGNILYYEFRANDLRFSCVSELPDCGEGAHYHVDQQQCVCDDGSAYGDLGCVSCPSNAYYDSNMEDCVCNEGYQASVDGDSLVCTEYQCPSHYTDDDGETYPLKLSMVDSESCHNFDGEYTNVVWVQPLDFDSGSLGCCYAFGTPEQNLSSTSESNITGSLSIESNDTNGTLTPFKADLNLSLNLDLTPVASRLDRVNGKLDQTNIKLDSIRSELRTQGGKVSDSIGKLGSMVDATLRSSTIDIVAKLDALRDTVHNKDLNVDIFPITQRQDEQTDLLRDINGSLGFFRDLSNMTVEANQTILNKLSEIQTVFNDALASFEQSKNDIASIVSPSDAPSVTVPAGDCSLSVPIFGQPFTIDLSVFSQFRPYLQFVLNLMLLFWSIKLYVWIGRDIVGYFLKD